MKFNKASSGISPEEDDDHQWAPLRRLTALSTLTTASEHMLTHKSMSMCVEQASANRPHLEPMRTAHSDIYIGHGVTLAGDSISENDESAHRASSSQHAKSRITSPSFSKPMSAARVVELHTHTSDHTQHSTDDDYSARTAGGKLQVKPRLRRRAPGFGGKQALGGRPEDDEDVDVGAVEFCPEMLKQHFTVPLSEAARRLGICVTAIKKVCRKMGIQKWPFQKLKPIEKRIAELQSHVRIETCIHACVRTYICEN